MEIVAFYQESAEQDRCHVEFSKDYSKYVSM